MSRLDEDNAASQAIRGVLGPFARAILVTTPQGNYAVPVEDLYVGKELRQTGSYSTGELNLLRSFCKPDTRLLVVGAHIGALAIPLAKSCRSVVAIEANPHTFELLRLNVALNGVTNFRPINKAAGNRAEPIEFILSRSNTGGSKRIPVVHAAEYFHDNPEVVKIEAVPLDDLLPAETFDVVLMDIEGSEYFALQGMQRILASAGVLQIEFLPHHLQHVAAVSVADFLALISPHFLSMRIPSKGTMVARERFLPVLTEMFDHDEGDAGLIFFKAPPEQVHWSPAPL
jgi:FkbM family methyltransferase